MTPEELIKILHNDPLYISAIKRAVNDEEKEQIRLKAEELIRQLHFAFSSVNLSKK